ncbi:type IV secretory system conjugative DNA transfer family protein [Ramlibacter sp. AN1133]|uniref:type IV secretory system conjugative DNA transfer family protein n=1 Tax=Ramlibacter sp. AN1133 TaxID=3133429 RepID=UPI0030BA9178
MRIELRALAAAALAAVSLAAGAQEAVDRIMNTVRQPAGEGEKLSVVRESALREAAVTLGARQGLLDKTCNIRREVQVQRAALDKRFRFSDLMMGRGVLPPVISEARDSVALDAAVMRVASRVYHLDEPARIVDVPPTWRDWLMVGLPPDQCGSVVNEALGLNTQLRPQNAAEEAFFRGLLSTSYQAGVQQAKTAFEDNLARLERAYHGMRRYFELYQRGMVSAPAIVSATDVVRRDDPNTLVVGNTLIRITVPVDFVEDAEKWKPLAP